MTVPNRAAHPNRVVGDHVTPVAELSKKTNSAGGSQWQAPASEEAAKIGKSWRNTPAHRAAHEAVLWTQKGARLTGTFVSPGKDPKTGESGVHLHQINTTPTFHKDSEVSEVHFVEKQGAPDSATRSEDYRKEQEARNQKVE